MHLSATRGRAKRDCNLHLHPESYAISRRVPLLNKPAVAPERQRETLCLIQAGETNESMAAKLQLTERAIEMRRSAIMRKLQVGSLPR